MATRKEHQISKMASSAFNRNNKNNNNQVSYLEWLDRQIEERISPDKWVDAYVKAHGTIKTRQDITSLIRLFDKDSVNKTCRFYKHALGYLKNKYYGGSLTANSAG
jgi:hypothetical protein